MMRRRVNQASQPSADKAAGHQVTTSSKLRAKLTKIDFYPKLEEDIQVRTKSGGLLFFVIGLAIFVLAFSEVLRYFRLTENDRIAVDNAIDHRLRINLNITFHALPCHKVELIAMDVSGEHQLNIHSTVHKKRLDEYGAPIGSARKAEVNVKTLEGNQPPLESLRPADYCGSCYGASTGCCNTCAEVKQAFQDRGWDTEKIAKGAEQCALERKYPELAMSSDAGCNLDGYLLVNKVAGNVHVAMGATKSVGGSLVHQIVPSQVEHFNVSHVIEHLSFGETFPGQINSLAGTQKVIDPTKSTTGVFQYYIQVIPTTYSTGVGNQLVTNQYTFTENFMPVGIVEPKTDKSDVASGKMHHHPSIISGLPGVFFIYDFSPFVVHRTVEHPSLTELITGLCAVVGGVLSISEIGHAIFARYSA